MPSYRMSNETKLRIIKLKEQGYIVSDIARELKISNNTVNLWWTRWKQEGTLDNHIASGRPRCTSAKQDAKIIAKAQKRKKQFINTGNISSEFAVSKSTVRRRLKEGFNRQAKESLAPKNKQLLQSTVNIKQIINISCEKSSESSSIDNANSEYIKVENPHGIVPSTCMNSLSETEVKVKKEKDEVTSFKREGEEVKIKTEPQDAMETNGSIQPLPIFEQYTVKIEKEEKENPEGDFE